MELEEIEHRKSLERPLLLFLQTSSQIVISRTIKSDKVQFIPVQAKIKVLPHMTKETVGNKLLVVPQLESFSQRIQECKCNNPNLLKTCEKSQLTMFRIRSAMAKGTRFHYQE
ncbi:hypothetical protein EXN66_Car012407 [Channa argus]|uniref:Uncharacterized protein n=1 Tax=Channa argus TaxID=215402 RepID=A0A6G1Q2P5_CHAAH|nr:hypothetical protein EXN66_Car012407 [Channa argus]